VIRYAHKVLVRKRESKKEFGRPRHRMEEILKWIIKKYGVRMWTGCIWLG
jgi:hypothetical protein